VVRVEVRGGKELLLHIGRIRHDTATSVRLSRML